MSKFSRRARVAVFAVVSSACVAGVGVLAPTGALAAPSPVLLAQSGGGAVQLTGSVTDTSGVLSSDEVSRLRDQINDVAESTGVNMRVVFVPTFEGQTAKEFATNLYDAYGGQRGVIFAVATQQRDYTTVYGPGVDPEVSKQITKAATSLLSDEKWFDAASAAISAVKDTEGGGSASSADGGGIDAGGAALAGGGALAVAGGAVAYARRRRKKDDEQRLEAARSMDPADTRGLQQQDLATLRTLAAEELVSTDESIRRASEELERAREEFGPARVAQFTQALESSKVTLARAFALKQAMTPQDEHATLVQIVSMCGMADDVLDAQAEEFAQMRSVLLTAPETLDSLTRKIVDGRSRVPAAAAALDKLIEAYGRESVASVVDNVELASSHLNDADRVLEHARTVAAKPAGQQQGLVDDIRAVEMTLQQVDMLLSGACSRAHHGTAGVDDVGRSLQLGVRVSHRLIKHLTLHTVVRSSRASLRQSRSQLSACLQQTRVGSQRIRATISDRQCLRCLIHRGVNIRQIHLRGGLLQRASIRNVGAHGGRQLRQVSMGATDGVISMLHTR